MGPASAKDPHRPDGKPSPLLSVIRIPQIERARARVRDHYYDREDVRQALIDALLLDLVRA